MTQFSLTPCDNDSLHGYEVWPSKAAGSDREISYESLSYIWGSPSPTSDSRLSELTWSPSTASSQLSARTKFFRGIFVEEIGEMSPWIQPVQVLIPQTNEHTIYENETRTSLASASLNFGWFSSASHSAVAGFLKGCYEDVRTTPARRLLLTDASGTSQQFDRDSVRIVKLILVYLISKALSEVLRALFYKVYPDFWGRFRQADDRPRKDIFVRDFPVTNFILV